MNTTQPVPDSQISGLVTGLAALDLGDWARPDITRVLSELGWTRAEEDAATTRLWTLRTGLPTGDAYAYPGESTGFRPSLTVSLANHGTDAERAAEVFHTARRAAERLLGHAPLRGGPGPWLRWRQPRTTLQLRFRGGWRQDGEDVRPEAGVSLEVLPTEQFEYRELRTFQHTPEDAPYLWCRLVHCDAAEGMLLPGDARAEGWKDFEERLERTLEALLDDAPLLGELPLTLMLSGPSLDGTPDCACYIKLTDDGLRLESALDPYPNVLSTLIELGWTPPSDDWIAALTSDDWDWFQEPSGEANFTHHLPGPGRGPAAKQAATAARLVVGALRTVATEPAELSYWVGRNGENTGMRLPLLGVH
ncbi:hypothetical protein [Streptomyces sp. NPDC005970]|uniref:DUF6301 family protein n=1 Tax=Streptomyces sp. NPDC005970 TaxID=3156723 RepID=UPI003406E183